MRVSVEMIAHGPSGIARYREGTNEHDFDWEFGGRDVIVSIYVPGAGEWDAAVPWAAGRRDEVLQRLGRAVARQQFPFGRFEIQERWVNICEARPPWRVVADWIERLRTPRTAR
jgi:hypothetical protein